ncbi:rCG48948 [Rattus norvegicus]|uniref:RCG48948 n=1 Tax=Rattus norvegicus TaxID=10116 RepID=A6IGW7_RAT|nr:rCG48948 [Rattus norvegicus]
MTSGNLGHKDSTFPKGVNPKFEDAQDSTEEDAGTTKAASVCAEAIEALQKSYDA